MLLTPLFFMLLVLGARCDSSDEDSKNHSGKKSKSGSDSDSSEDSDSDSGSSDSDSDSNDNSREAPSCPPWANRNDFLSYILQTPKTNIGRVANNFKFLQSVNGDYVNIYYYKKNSGRPIQVTPENYRSIQTGKSIIIIAHGWKSNFNDSWVKKMADAYNKNGDYTVLALEWGYYSKDSYVDSASAVSQVGNSLGLFIYRVFNNTLNKVHLVGHSLGAHVCGIAGRWIFKNYREKLARITGLDPAGPLFEIPFKRPQIVSKGDATFVDIIHTNVAYLGIYESYGDADFFPALESNIQKGCDNDSGEESQQYAEMFCSSAKAHVYFSESITNEKKYKCRACFDEYEFRSGVCDQNEVAYMGNGVSQTAYGNFLLEIS